FLPSGDQDGASPTPSTEAPVPSGLISPTTGWGAPPTATLSKTYAIFSKRTIGLQEISKWTGVIVRRVTMTVRVSPERLQFSGIACSEIAWAPGSRRLTT